jgi:vitamin B12 transporter
MHGVSASMRLPVTVLCCAACASATASPDDPARGTNHVVVTATRVPTPVEEVLAPVIVIDRDDIERSAAGDVAELLRFHTGLELGRNGGPGQTTAVFIRGADSNHTLVLVDGVRINPGTIGVAPLQNISPSMVERIEVVKGPRSALYGTDAIGGVINVITRRGAQDGWVTEVGYGDYDTRQASLNGGFATERVEIDLGVAWLDSSGFPTRTIDDVDRGYENLSASAQLRADLGPAELALRHWRAEGTSEYSDFFLTPVDQDFENSTTALYVDWPVGAAAEARIGASHFEDRIEQNQSPDYLRTRRDSVDAQVDWRASQRHALAAGAMYASEQARSESFGDRMRADTDALTLFVQDSIDAGRHRALLALGYTDHETAGDAVTWNAEYGLALSEATQAYGLAGTGFRAPDATDRYGFGGNPDLEPEESTNYEIGIRHRLGDRHALSLAAFRNDIDNLIEFVTISYDPFDGVNRNVEEARIEGVEAAWEYDAAPWRARVGAIHQDPRNQTTDQALLRRARDSLTVSVQRAFGRFDLGLDVLAAGERKDFGFPRLVTLDSYVLANLTARWRVTRSLSLVGRIENLLDEQYELAHTFNTPDRGLYVSLRYAPGVGAGGAAVVAKRNAPADAVPAAYSASARSRHPERSWAID